MALLILVINDLVALAVVSMSALACNYHIFATVVNTQTILHVTEVSDNYVKIDDRIKKTYKHISWQKKKVDQASINNIINQSIMQLVIV